ncbi:ATP-binding protein [Marinobacterium iners]|uniref:Histidine kinase-, DNA gyrase B-, and HSP90-like ATPase n=1 Tax=Marinobacterium iners DSM 11526 TaxID=1122198 RepID=A0A1H3ZZI4_9GAMM|nr:ATP-binding protein [Marinobacterium iners]SEA28634.1 Histidine kinase-, DNA gyrase B-, and HSP90-like ATPase [Marinobacterium iners DSM 11526]
MEIKVFQGDANITDVGIKNLFSGKRNDPVYALVELVANGFDAGATRVDVKINWNDAHGLESVTVLDNGHGIDTEKCDEHFGRFNESSKVDDDDTQGSQGRGRVSFHLLCDLAQWFTRCNGVDACLKIESSNVRHYEGKFLEEKEQHALLYDCQNGTCVELSRFHKNLPSAEEIIKRFSYEFGWRLLLNNEGRSLFVNGSEVPIPPYEKERHVLKIDDYDFVIDFVRWIKKPGEEKSYNYLVNNSGRIVHREYSKFNNKASFHLSTYSSSIWNEYFNKHGGMNFDHDVDASPTTPVYRKLRSEIEAKGREIYDNFLRRMADQKMDEFEEKGYFPSYKKLDSSYAEWRKKNTRNTLKEIYYADPTIFNNIKSKQIKIIIGLLDKVLVSNENDALLDVLEGVIKLEPEKMEQFADHIRKSSLDNIVSTIETLSKRESIINALKYVMEEQYKEILETPDLQKVIEANTWLFGNKYTIIGAEEDDFYKTSKALRDKVEGINFIDESDLDKSDLLSEGFDIEGMRGQVDLFLARKNIEFDTNGREYFKATIIEIKRPIVSLNDKHLDQIKRYAKVISQCSGFDANNLKFDIILVGRKISEKSFDIPNSLKSCEKENDPGRVYITSDERIKCYVKTWASIFNEFELSNSYLLRNLKMKRDVLEGKAGKEVIADAQVSIH